MRQVATGFLALVLLGAASCGGDAPPPEDAAAEAAGEATDAAEPASAPQSETAPDAGSSAAEAVATAPEARPAAPGAPVFAVIYPGGVVQADVEQPGAAPGVDGELSFRVAATPQTVVDFYRARAEAEGLASVMAMNQGATRAYGAHSTVTGANLAVMATEEDGGASVQLT